MKARKIMIAVLAVVLAMQMTGCKNNIDTEKPVVINVSVSDSDVEPKAELTWTELGKLTTYEKMRTAVDTTFGNKIVDGVKYGSFYLDKDEKQCTNNTLSIVLGNQFVAEEFKNNAVEDVQTALDAIYTDLSDSDYTPALFNAYFNLLPDSTPNYFNGGDTLSRAEAMALVTRAVTPVQSLNVSDDFTSAVEGTDYDQYINYAAQQNASSYINTNDKSLTADNFKGAMSRAEFIYLIMNEVYGTENVQSYDTTSSALKDCTNAGDLSAELKIAGSDRCNGYTLSHSLKNVDKGVQEELYKPLAMAVDKGIITPETRWNEGITKSEAIEIVVNAFSQYYDENGYLVNNADKGSTQVLEAQALELWNKQDQNDMNCTKEQFIADYIKEISNGMTSEQFEKIIPSLYSIKFAEEMEKKEQESVLNTHIKALWKKLKDRLTCDESTFTEEYKSQSDKQGESFTEEGFTEYILDKYGIKEETTANNNSTDELSNTDDNSSKNDTPVQDEEPVYTPPAQDEEPVYTPPVQDEKPVYTPPVQDEEPVYTPPAQEEPVYTPPVQVEEPVYTPPAQEEPVYTPPVDNGGDSGDDFVDFPIITVDPDDLDDIHLVG